MSTVRARCNTALRKVFRKCGRGWSMDGNARRIARGCGWQGCANPKLIPSVIRCECRYQACQAGCRWLPTARATPSVRISRPLVPTTSSRSPVRSSKYTLCCSPNAAAATRPMRPPREPPIALPRGSHSVDMRDDRSALPDQSANSRHEHLKTFNSHHCGVAIRNLSSQPERVNLIGLHACFAIRAYCNTVVAGCV